MAVAVYADVVSSLSGALTKINKKSPHAVDQKMVLATHRNAPTTQIGKCNRMYLRGLNSVTRSTPVSADEVKTLVKFTIENNGIAYANDVIMKLASQAKNIIDSFPSSQITESLNHYVDFIIERNF